MKHNCPYLMSNKYCTFKNGNVKGKVKCIYSKPQKCIFWKDWVDRLIKEEKSHKDSLKSTQHTYKERIVSLIKKWEK